MGISEAKMFQNMYNYNGLKVRAKKRCLLQKLFKKMIIWLKVQKHDLSTNKRSWRGRKACTYTLSSNVCNFNNQKSEIKHKTNQIPIFLYVFSDAIKSKNNKNGWYFFLTHPVKRIFIFHTLLIDSTCLLLCWDSYG